MRARGVRRLPAGGDCLDCHLLPPFLEFRLGQGAPAGPPQTIPSARRPAISAPDRPSHSERTSSVCSPRRGAALLIAAGDSPSRIGGDRSGHGTAGGRDKVGIWQGGGHDWKRGGGEKG